MAAMRSNQTQGESASRRYPFPDWFGQSPAWKPEAIQLEEDFKANSLGQEYSDYFCLL